MGAGGLFVRDKCSGRVSDSRSNSGGESVGFARRLRKQDADLAAEHHINKLPWRSVDGLQEKGRRRVGSGKGRCIEGVQAI